MSPARGRHTPPAKSRQSAAAGANSGSDVEVTVSHNRKKIQIRNKNDPSSSGIVIDAADVDNFKAVLHRAAQERSKTNESR